MQNFYYYLKNTISPFLMHQYYLSSRFLIKEKQWDAQIHKQIFLTEFSPPFLIIFHLRIQSKDFISWL